MDDETKVTRTPDVVTVPPVQNSLAPPKNSGPANPGTCAEAGPINMRAATKSHRIILTTSPLPYEIGVM